jgi:hypothetical protein
LDSNGNLKNQIHGVQRGIANAVEEANKNISSNIGAKTSSETENSHKEKSLEKPAKEEKTNIDYESTIARFFFYFRYDDT